MHGRQGFTPVAGRSNQSLDIMSIPNQDFRKSLRKRAYPLLRAWLIGTFCFGLSLSHLSIPAHSLPKLILVSFAFSTSVMAIILVVVSLVDRYGKGSETDLS
jgi:hypothetical protein